MANFPALLNGVNPGVVRDIVKKGNITYFCGTFSSVGGVTGYAGLARINSSGQVDQSWKPVAGNSGRYLFVSDDISKVYTVSSSGGLRKFLTTATTVQTFTALNFSPNAPILADGNFIYVSVGLFGGSASSSRVTPYIAGVAQPFVYRAGVLKIDVTGNSGQGSVDSNFVPLDNAGALGDIYAMAQDADHIYIGGDFNKFGNATSNHRLCKINKSNGQVASDWSQGSGFNAGIVKSIVVGSNSALYAGGSFYSFNGTTKPGVAKISKQGALDTNFASPIASNVATVGGAISPVGPTKLIEANSCLYLGGSQSRTTVFAPVPGKGIVKSSGLSTFTLDASFDITTGLSQTGTAGTYMEVSSLHYDGSNLYVGASCQVGTDVPYFKTVQGPVWTINKATAAVTSLIDNSAMPASFSLTSFAANQSVTATILKDSVSGQAKVQAHATLNNAASWRWIVLVYTKSTGGKHYEGFDARLGSPTGKIKTSLAGGTSLTFSHLFVVNSARQKVKILASDISNASNLNLSVTA